MSSVSQGFRPRLYGRFGLSPQSTIVDSGFGIRLAHLVALFRTVNGFNGLLQRQGTAAMASLLQ